MIIKYLEDKKAWFRICEDVFGIKEDDEVRIRHYKELALELAICIVDEEDDNTVIMWKLQHLADTIYKN